MERRRMMNTPSSDRPGGSHRSGESNNRTGQRLHPGGGDRKLRSFQVTTLIYDATVSFCARFVDKRSRTVDQMVQAARSGRQNILEGSRASATSSQTERRLVNVARASLDELRLDYEDFLRQRALRAWARKDREALAVRAVGRLVERTDRADPGDRSDEAHAAAYALWLRHCDPAVVANAIICLIHRANNLLGQQIEELERDFIDEGGSSERLAAARITERENQPARSPSAPLAPNCPLCARPMARRTARQGANAGSQFWGCSGYPDCKGTRALGAG